MWEFLFSSKGLKIWLGELETEFELKKEYRTENGIKGLVRVFKPNHTLVLTVKREVG